MNIKYFKTGLLIGLIISIILGLSFYFMFLQSPNINLKKMNIVDLNGNKIDINDFLNKPLVVNYWATWCAPCIEEFPIFIEVNKNYEEKINFIFITDEKTKIIKQFQNKRNFNIYIAKTYNNMDSMGLNIRPTTYFYKKNGIYKNSIIGQIKKIELDSIVSELIKQ